MERVMTIGEFSDYFADREFSNVCFLTENQEWGKDIQPAAMSICFKDLITSEVPNVVAFSDGNSILSIQRVQRVRVKDSCVGEVVTVECGGLRAPIPEKRFVFVLS